VASTTKALFVTLPLVNGRSADVHGAPWELVDGDRGTLCHFTSGALLEVALDRAAVRAKCDPDLPWLADLPLVGGRKADIRSVPSEIEDAPNRDDACIAYFSSGTRLLFAIPREKFKAVLDKALDKLRARAALTAGLRGGGGVG